MTAPGADVPPPLPPGAFGRAPIGYAHARTVQSGAPFDLQPFFTHLTCWAVALTIFLVMTVFVVPRIRAIFLDFRIDLPMPTKVLFTIGRWPVAVAPLVLLLLVGAGDSVAAGFWHRRSTPGSRRGYRLAVAFIVGAITLFVALAIFVPYVVLIDGLSGSSGKR